MNIEIDFDPTSEKKVAVQISQGSMTTPMLSAAEEMIADAELTQWVGTPEIENNFQNVVAGQN